MRKNHVFHIFCIYNLILLSRKRKFLGKFTFCFIFEAWGITSRIIFAMMGYKWVYVYICVYVYMFTFIISVLVMSRNSCIRQSMNIPIQFPTVNNVLFKNICYCSWNYRLFRKWEENETNKPLLQWVFMIAVLINYSFIHVMFSSFHFHILFIHLHSSVLRKQLNKNGQQIFIVFAPNHLLNVFLLFSCNSYAHKLCFKHYNCVCIMLRHSSWYLWLGITFISF